MKLQRLHLENFKRFRAPFTLDGLDSGLNLFTAPNEAGKSTLVEAIRAAFFERHRSSTVEHLRPWGDSAATPTVVLDFVVNGASCRLTKAFLGKKRCELQLEGRALVRPVDPGRFGEGHPLPVDHQRLFQQGFLARVQAGDSRPGHAHALGDGALVHAPGCGRAGLGFPRAAAACGHGA